jgi:NAD-dependent dihydropyrimidine dehydrogenase PreA subunit
VTLINVDREKCNKDGICIAECPAQVLRIDHGDEYPTTTPDFEEVCIECGHCVAVCPTGAFSLEWLSPEECPAIRKELMLSPEQAEQFLRSRRSIRVFKDKPVERAKLEKLIEVGGGV